MGNIIIRFALHHFWQTMDHDIEKTADQEAKQAGYRSAKDISRCCEQDGIGHYTTCPNLKIGRYIAITKPPISTPKTTMMSGSIRLDIASTASSTSCS